MAHYDDNDRIGPIATMTLMDRGDVEAYKRAVHSELDSMLRQRLAMHGPDDLPSPRELLIHGLLAKTPTSELAELVGRCTTLPEHSRSQV